ncbi:hypothetical protein [Demequina soli]|uniref:hypothetical protein n=1 Tax=Demequina soli TaxID=1638987 RepID=UPI0007812B30|nr:hypothetical protein [Demequina soli]
MSNELMESLARQAESGGALYDTRPVDDAVVAPARRRVRRARTMRAVGTVGVTALVLAGVTAAALQWDGGRHHVAPALPTQDATPALRADDLLHGMSTRVRGETSTAQAATVCYLADGKNPWVEDNYKVSTTVFDNCPAMWIGTSHLIELESTTVVVGGGGSIRVEYLVTNTSSDPLMIDPVGSTVALLTAPDAVVTLPSTADGQYVGTSLWQSDTTRSAEMGGDSGPIRLEPGAHYEGATTYTAQVLRGSDANDIAQRFSAGELDATVTVQLRIAPDGTPGTRELFLEASETLAASGTVTPSSWVFDGLEPRTPGETRDDAQAALDCRVGGDQNPRTQEPLDADTLGTSPTCDAVWIPGGKELRLSSLDFAVNGTSRTLEVSWTLENATAAALSLDRASTALLMETDPSTPAGESTWFQADTAGGVSGDTLWQSHTTRHGFLTNLTAADGQLMPGGTLEGTHTFEGYDAPPDGATYSVLIRVARDDDANGDRELLLEVPWEG